MNLKNNRMMRETRLFVLGIALVLLLMILASCQTRFVPVYLGAEGKVWVLKADACIALQQPEITEADYRTSKALRDHVVALDAQWVGFGCEEVVPQ
jgi:hypothetical protein